MTAEEGREHTQAGFGTSQYRWFQRSRANGREICPPAFGPGEADIQGFVAFSTSLAAYEHLIGWKANGSAMLITETQR